MRTALADTGQRSANALVVAGAGDFLAYRQLIVDVLRQISVPAMYPYRDYVEVGGLMTYAPELGDLALHLAMAVQQILRGEKPGDIPVYQAARFELVINLKTAKALSLTMPQSLLAGADEVIE